MASILLHPAEEAVTMTAQAARKLLECGDGDAALLYLALLRHHGEVLPRSLKELQQLRWDMARIDRAEQVLRELQLITASKAKADLPQEPAEERPAYQQNYIAQQLSDNMDFRSLTAAVEKRLNKKLSTPDLGILLSLNDYLGLPSDVIYLLVCHCAERVERRYGSGRRPGMRQIEKEGYAWARDGIDNQTAATEYLRQYAQRQQSLPAFMRVLQLGERAPSPSEEKYLLAWQEMGFSPDAVALAYDKTMMKCHELKWPYCNAILKRWHEAGMHTVAEIQTGDRTGQQKQQTSAPADNSWMRQYIQQLEEE